MHGKLLLIAVLACCFGSSCSHIIDISDRNKSEGHYSGIKLFLLE